MYLYINGAEAMFIAVEISPRMREPAIRAFAWRENLNSEHEVYGGVVVFSGVWCVGPGRHGSGGAGQRRSG